MTPNRIVAVAVAALGVATLIVSMAADLGLAPQAVGIAAGAVVFLTPAVVWLKGWQAYEARQGEADQPVGWDDAEELVRRLAEDPEALRLAIDRVRSTSDPAHLTPE